MSQPTFDQFGNQVQPAQQDGDGIKALRKQFKEMKKTLEAKDAEIAALKAQAQTGSVADALAQHGLNPLVAKFYPADRATTADAVAEWVTENRELFPTPQESAQQQTSQTTLTPIQQEGFRIMQALGEAEAATQMDFKSRGDAIETEEEYLAFLEEFSTLHPFG